MTDLSESPMNTIAQPHLLAEMTDDSILDANSMIYLESLYENYLADPSSIAPKWQDYFNQLPKVNGHSHEFMHSQIRSQFKNIGLKNQTTIVQATDSENSTNNEHDKKQVKVMQLINSYRFLGHLKANTNPLNANETSDIPELSLGYHELSQDDLDTAFLTGSLNAADKLKLRDIINLLETSYCSSVGAQYMYISSVEEKRWLQERIEGSDYQVANIETQKNILASLIAAETLERYLHAKYVGQKRFSLEGGESLIPLMDALIQHSGSQSVEEIVIGMAHRGRLNVLINTMGKSPATLFNEFEGTVDNGGRSGDVKYHLGYSSDVKTPGGPVHIALAFNPSHLEIVGPVVEGAVRARQDRRPIDKVQQVMPVVIHGDAALAGQGVNMETMNMSQTDGYGTMGTVHIVINNQIGFTTSRARDARSSQYCTDLAKMIDAPVFHVNGDSPEAVVEITKIAVDYRQKFNKDIIIDMVCYRRHGHNEADEAPATQPVMYHKIRALETTQSLYANYLVDKQIINNDEVKQMIGDYRASLAKGYPIVPQLISDISKHAYPVDWARFKGGQWEQELNTNISQDLLNELGQQLINTPDEFKLNARVAALMKKRTQMAAGELPVDWGFGENLAYASLLNEGYPVRISGEDCGRGTFFHRHAVLHEQSSGEHHIPLKQIAKQSEDFVVIDSLLSEEAVLAFEYGYASTEADKLVIWEAQFGDFANGAQVVIDQFISSAEQKWGLLCGLVMFLPHGYEGMGPEHSSARLERYMQLCAQNNIQVCVPSTPAQVFHMLRRQMLRTYRTPLVVMTPKSLLRHPLAISQQSEFVNSSFKPVIDEFDDLDKEKVTRMVFCSGKVYYELLERRRKEEIKHIALVRIEQLYPFPDKVLCEILEQYPNVDNFIWCQEEPLNQGAWLSIQPWLRLALGGFARLEVVSRPAMAAPAEGSHKTFLVSQEKVICEALCIDKDKE